VLIISGLEKDEATGGWRYTNNKKLHNLYCSREMRRTGHVARMGDDKCFGQKTDHLEDIGVGRRIISKRVLKK
jgi:hypothetical protein